MSAEGTALPPPPSGRGEEAQRLKANTCARFPAEHGVPTSVDFNGCDPAHMVASFHSGDVVIYDLETSQNALVLKGQGDDGESHTLA